MRKSQTKDMQIGSRIKTLREEHSQTQKEFAEAMGVSSQAVSNYEQDNREPSIEVLGRLAKHLKISLDYLVTGKEHEATIIEFPPLPLRQDTENKKFPILGKISAGKPLFAIENIDGYFPEDYLLREQFFFLRVSGDSMRDLRIFDGDLVLVKKQDSANDRDIVVALINGYETTLKIYQESKDGISLIPANASYKPIFFPRTELEANPELFKIQGIATKLLADI